MRNADPEAEVLLVPGGLADEDGERAAQQLLAPQSPPTAVTAFNDHCAAGLLATARRRGVDVPQDLSIVGYDDSRIARVATVALTTVGQDAAALAECALHRAVGWAEGTVEGSCEVLLPPHLVIRQHDRRCRIMTGGRAAITSGRAAAGYRGSAMPVAVVLAAIRHPPFTWRCRAREQQEPTRRGRSRAIMTIAHTG